MKAIPISVHRGIGALVLFFHIAVAGAQSGALDTSFDPGTGANIPILRSVVLPNGSYVIAGGFTSYAGNPCGRIARVLPGGGYDPTFVSGTGFNDQVNQIRVQSDGKIIAVGPFTQYNGTTVNRIVRLLPDGSLDGTFQPVNSNTLFTSMLEVLPDDRVLVSGSLSIPGVAGAVRLARFMPDGTLDQVLATMSNTNGLITSVLTIPDGRVMIGGSFTSVQGQTRNGIALLSSSGVLDTSFDPGSGFSTTSLTLQRLILGPSGGIYAVGFFTQYNGTNVNYLVRLLTSGAIDPTWNTSNVYNAPVSTVLELPGDKILLGGSFVEVNGISKPGVCALTLNGDLIPSFPRGSGSVGPVFQFHQLPSGNLLINGNFSSYNGVPRKNIARLLYCPVDEWYPDSDNDGAGAAGSPLITCAPPVGYVSNATDCDDDDPLITDGTIWYADADGDGAGDANAQQTACSAPVGFVDNDDDCNDADPLVAGPTLWYLDQDGDGFGNVMAPTQLACIAPPGHVADNTDCNDFDPAVHETSNWYADADGDGFGDANALQVSCNQPPGYVANDTDCDDTDPLNTNGPVWYADADGDGAGDAAVQQNACFGPVGFVDNDEDCNDADPLVVGPTLWYMDQDGDGFGNVMAPTQQGCTAPAGHVADNTDCNDFDPTVHELSNWYADSDGDGFGDPSSIIVTCSRPTGYVSNANDCDDFDPMATVVRNWYADADGDGFGNAAAPLASCAQPPGHVLDATDCNDSSPTITGPTTWYLDSDGDAFGLTAQTQVACTQPLGYSASGGDCNDADPLIFPNAPCDDGNAVTHFDRIRPDCSCAGQGVQVSPIVYLDVPLNAQGWMNASLLANGLLPTVEPYTAMGYTNFANGVGGFTTTAQMLDPDPLHPELQAVDWVIVELRDIGTPNTILGASACILRRNGLIHRPDVLEAPEFELPQGNYLVSIRHRNHLGVVTSAPVLLDQPTPVVLNFTNGSVTVNGGPNALKPNGTKLALWPGDVRFNRNVQYTGQNNDRDPILVRIGGLVPTNTVQGYFPEDVNLDGVVKYTGTNNDRDKVLQTIGGVVPTNIRLDHLPN